MQVRPRREYPTHFRHRIRGNGSFTGQPCRQTQDMAISCRGRLGASLWTMSSWRRGPGASSLCLSGSAMPSGPSRARGRAVTESSRIGLSMIGTRRKTWPMSRHGHHRCAATRARQPLRGNTSGPITHLRPSDFRRVGLPWPRSNLREPRGVLRVSPNRPELDRRRPPPPDRPVPGRVLMGAMLGPLSRSIGATSTDVRPGA